MPLTALSHIREILADHNYFLLIVQISTTINTFIPKKYEKEEDKKIPIFVPILLQGKIPDFNTKNDNNKLSEVLTADAVITSFNEVLNIDTSLIGAVNSGLSLGDNVATKLVKNIDIIPIKQQGQSIITITLEFGKFSTKEILLKNYAELYGQNIQNMRFHLISKTDYIFNLRLTNMIRSDLHKNNRTMTLSLIRMPQKITKTGNDNNVNTSGDE